MIRPVEEEGFTEAVVRWCFVRINTDGQEIARLGFTYTLRSNAGSWQIVVALLHEPVAA